MDVRCEKCGTEYELEDSKVTPKGVKVKCTQCGHLFRVVRQPTLPPLMIQGKEPGKIAVSGGTAGTGKPGSAAAADPSPRSGSGTAKLGSLATAATLAAGPEQASAKAAGPAPGKATLLGPPAQKPAPKAVGPAQSRAAVPVKAPAGQKTPPMADAARSGAAAEDGGKPSDTPPAAKKVEPKRWYIRKPSGEIFQFRELTTLQQWIVEEKVCRDDEISRTGRTWEKLGVIEELAPFFSVVDQARVAREAETEALQESGPHPRPRPARPLEPGLEKRPPAPGAAELVDEDAPTGRRGEGPKAATSGPWELGGAVAAAAARDEPSELGDTGSGGQTAAWEADGLRVGSEAREPTAEVVLDDEMLSVRRPGAMAVKVAAVAVVGGLIGLAVFVVWSKWEKIIDMLSGDRDKTADYYGRGRALLRQDTDEAFKKALEQFKLVLGAKGSAEARASRAEVLALWSLYLSEDVGRLEKKAAELEAKAAGSGMGSAGARTVQPPGVEKLRKEAAALKQKARSLAIRAYHDAQLALKKKSSALTHRAQAEALLALGKPLKDVKLHLEKSLGYSGNDPETFYAKALFLIRQSKWEKARQVLNQAVMINRRQSSKILYRAHYLLATVLARKRDAGGARTELQTILGTNPTHKRAKRFLDELSPGAAPRPRPVVVAVQPGPDAGAPAVEPRDARTRPHSGSSDGVKLSGDYRTLVRKGDRFSENNRLGDALKAYQKALQLRPSGVEALIGLAYCHLDRRNRSKALSTFRRALRVRPGYGEALIGMAQTYKRMGNLSKALEFYKKYLKHHPSGRKSGLARRNVQNLEDKLKVSRPPPTVTPPARPPVTVPPARPPPDTRPPPRPPDMGAPSRPAPTRPSGMETPRPARPAPRPSGMEASP